MAVKSARFVVLNALLRMEKDQSYSNLVLDMYLKKSELSLQDKNFASRLFYGVIERKLTLDYIVSSYSKQPVLHLDLAVRIILWMGLYQLLYMNIPESAAVNESVKLAAAIKPSAKGFINAVLRQFLRDGKEIRWPDPQKNPLLYTSVRYSCPEWLISQYQQDYGIGRTESILKNSLLSPSIVIRSNPLRVSDEKLECFLREEGVEISRMPQLRHCFKVLKGNPVDTVSFSKGFFHVQDIASQLCALVVAAGKPKKVLDLCAAPGGKTFTIGEEISFYGGKVQAFDLHQKRVRLIQKGVQRLGLENTITAFEGDASLLNSRLEKADSVLCDVPCSGLGVIRRKPEIKYKPSKTLSDLPLIQNKILENATNYVAPDGYLIYSTCSLSKRENEQVVEAFLKRHSEFSPEPLPDVFPFPKGEFQTTFFPEEDGPDGFYLARMRKVE